MKNLVINNSSLSITSVIHNIDSSTSPYINRLFGDKSIYLHRDKYVTNNKFNEYKIYLKNLDKSVLKSRLTIHELNPQCSIELLGFSYLHDDKSNEYNPFNVFYREKGPAIGYGELSLNTLINKPIKCYYRGLYENWRGESVVTKPNYWTTVIYCPILHDKYCEKIMKRDEYLSAKVTIHFYKQYLFSTPLKYSTDIIIKFVNINNLQDNNLIDIYQPKLGICVAIPHISSDNDKVAANSAMLFEWIRYYLKLGLRVFVYDRDGNNYDYVFNSVYSVRGFDKETIHNLVYNNFTIRGLLDPKSKGLKYDNTDVRKYSLIGKNVMLSDSDKQLTLTHCRFDAKAKYNIEDVIVSDFDEFLYCPIAGSTAFNQSNYLHNLILYHKRAGVDQMVFSQRIMSNTTNSIRTCLLTHINQNLSSSVLECFSPYEYLSDQHSVKSIHLGLKCPMTGFHTSCPYEKSSILSHDCLCNSLHIMETCQFMHLTSNFKHYFIEGTKYLDHDTITKIRSTENELVKILNS